MNSLNLDDIRDFFDELGYMPLKEAEEWMNFISSFFKYLGSFCGVGLLRLDWYHKNWKLIFLNVYDSDCQQLCLAA
jgi:hypothetical protein